MADRAGRAAAGAASLPPRYSPCTGAMLAAVVDSIVRIRRQRSRSAPRPSASVSGMAAKQALNLQETLVGKIPACRLVERFDHALVAITIAVGREAW